MAAPMYSLPPGLIARLGRDIFLLRRRDFRQDAITCTARLKPPIRILQPENIPQRGPCVVTVNHYHRMGFHAEWLALAISSLVAVRMHWIMTGEFMGEGKWYRTLGEMSSRLLLKRIAHIYGFTTMPPMPPRPEDVEERAASVRAVLQYVRQTEEPVIGLAPEGYDPPDGVLTRPAPGVGRFGLLMSKAGLRFVPVGVYESEGCLHVHFGASYGLNVPPDLTPAEKDERVSQIMMENIAGLLPVHLRGEFIEKT